MLVTRTASYLVRTEVQCVLRCQSGLVNVQGVCILTGRNFVESASVDDCIETVF